MRRLHEMTKPIRKQEVHNDLPPLNSDSEDGGSWGSEVESHELDDSEDDESLFDTNSVISDNSDDEMPYETAARTRRHLWNSPKSEVPRLPIKLPDGRIKATGTKVITTKKVVVQSEDEDSTSEPESEPEPLKVDDVSTGARFGRVSVVDILQTKSRRHMIEMAKIQIAGICQDILADPENSVWFIILIMIRIYSFA
jgi:nucleolar complex protein 3